VNAQDFEYGSPSELIGAVWIYVYTGPDLEVRENILKTIKKDLRHLCVAERPEEADVVLVFGANAYTQYRGTYSTSNWEGNAYSYGSGASANGSVNSSSVPIYGSVIDGEGWILTWSEAGRARIVSQYADTKTTIFERRPSTNFARHFVKEYVKANPTRPLAKEPRGTGAQAASTLTPEQALFAEKARGVIEEFANNLGLEGEWRAVLMRRALPHLQNLMAIDVRAGTEEISDTIRGAASDIARLDTLAELRLRGYEPEAFNAIRDSCPDTTGFHEWYSNSMALYSEGHPNLEPTDVEIFVSQIKDEAAAACVDVEGD